MERDRLAALARAFEEAFNQPDVEQIVGRMTEDSVFERMSGARVEGRAALRAAFAPILRGDMGPVHYDIEDILVDEGRQAVVVSWVVSKETPDGRKSRRGLDVLLFEGDLIKLKQSYTKHGEPLLPA